MKPYYLPTDLSVPLTHPPIHLPAYLPGDNTTLDYHHNAGWCWGPGTPDDCSVANVACPNGEDEEAAAACWTVCAGKYPDLVSVDIGEYSAGAGMCGCCCQTECSCLQDIGDYSFAVRGGSDVPGSCDGDDWDEDYEYNDYYSNNDGGCYSQAWFAISDSGEEGTWVCSTTGEAITYSNWEDGEPNDCCGGYTCPDSPAQDPGIEWGCHTSSSSEPADVFEGGYTLFLNEDNGGLQKVWYTLQFSEDVTVTSVTCKYDAGATGES